MPTLNDPNGQPQSVNSEGRAFVHAVTSTEAHHVNHHEGQAYSCGFGVTMSGTDKCIGYIKNDSVMDMVIADVMFTSAAAGTMFTFKFGDTGTPANTTAVTPVNRNAGSGNEADVTAYVTSSAANGITDLSGGSNLLRYTVGVANQTNHFSPESGFVIPKNQIMTIYCSAAAAVRVGLGINFHDIEA